jgi:hypothetical protein
MLEEVTRAYALTEGNVSPSPCLCALITSLSSGTFSHV